MSFSDIYIDLSNPMNSFKFYHNEKSSVKVCREEMGLIDEIIKSVKEKMSSGSSTFRLNLRGKLYRCTIIKSVAGVFADLRVQPMKLMTIDEIDINPIIKYQSLHPRLNKGGLILVIGAPGEGKTTTCSALLIERLKRFGGMCLTIEDPAELRLHGTHGAGQCIQVEVEGREEFVEAGRLAMRCYPTNKPSIMFIGEIRDSTSASLALRAALDGRLVIATFHADSIISALKRIVSYASAEMSEVEARALLYNGFRLCMQQKLSNGSVAGEVLIDTPTAAPLIRIGKFDQLGSEIDQQKILVEQRKPIQSRGEFFN